MRIKGFFNDEQGNWSMGRMLLVCALFLTFSLIWMDTLCDVDVPEPAYGLLGIIFVGLLGWVGGPRIMQHIGGQLGAIMQRAGGAFSGFGSSTPPPPSPGGPSEYDQSPPGGES